MKDGGPPNWFNDNRDHVYSSAVSDENMSSSANIKHADNIL